jgi:hypothetical protein
VIAEKCCLSCAKLGVNLEEKYEEKEEGVILELGIGIHQLKKIALSLLGVSAIAINKFCHQDAPHRTKCCLALDFPQIDENMDLSEELISFRNASIAVGHPQSTAGSEISRMKIIIKVTPSEAGPFCGYPSASSFGLSESSSPQEIFLDRYLLIQAITDYKDDIERDIAARVLRVYLPGHLIVEPEPEVVSQDRTVVIAAAVSSVVFVIALVCAVVFGKKFHLSRYARARKTANDFITADPQA